MKRCMAQTLEEFEHKVERPLRALPPNPATASILRDCDDVKRSFRRKLQAFATDCADLMPSDVQINAYEPVARSRA